MRCYPQRPVAVGIASTMPFTASFSLAERHAGRWRCRAACCADCAPQSCLALFAFHFLLSCLLSPGALPRDPDRRIGVRLERDARQPHQLPAQRRHQGLDGGSSDDEGEIMCCFAPCRRLSFASQVVSGARFSGTWVLVVPVLLGMLAIYFLLLMSLCWIVVAAEVSLDAVGFRNPSPSQPNKRIIQRTLSYDTGGRQEQADHPASAGVRREGHRSYPGKRHPGVRR